MEVSNKILQILISNCCLALFVWQADVHQQSGVLNWNFLISLKFSKKSPLIILFYILFFELIFLYFLLHLLIQTLHLLPTDKSLQLYIYKKNKLLYIIPLLFYLPLLTLLNRIYFRLWLLQYAQGLCQLFLTFIFLTLGKNLQK